MTLCAWGRGVTPIGPSGVPRHVISNVMSPPLSEKGEMRMLSIVLTVLALWTANVECFSVLPNQHFLRERNPALRSGLRPAHAFTTRTEIVERCRTPVNLKMGLFDIFQDGNNAIIWICYSILTLHNLIFLSRIRLQKLLWRKYRLLHTAKIADQIPCWEQCHGWQTKQTLMR